MYPGPHHSPSPTSIQRTPPETPYLDLIDDAMKSLLHAMSGDTTPPEQTSDSSIPDKLPGPIPGWGLFEAMGDTELSMPLADQEVAGISKALLDHLQMADIPVGSDDEEDEQPDIPADDSEDIQEPNITCKSKSIILLHYLINHQP